MLIPLRRRGRRQAKTSIDPEPVADNFCEWAANLPFVVERVHGLSETVKTYAVVCEPLAQGSTWLVLDFASDSPRPKSISVLLPRRLAEQATRSAWGHVSTPGSGGRTAYAPPRENHVIFQIDPLAGRRHVETLVLGAYRSIIDWTGPGRKTA